MKKYILFALCCCLATLSCDKKVIPKPVDPVVTTPPVVVDPPKPVTPTNQDKEDLDKVQKACFNYFWYGHPDAGMSFERSSNRSLVTTGGTGFGLMGMVAAVSRNFVSRSEAIAKTKKILAFLEKADKYHGAFAHWYNGNSGQVQKFSEKDDGGDLVETSFMMAGLLTVREFFNAENTDEKDIRDRITKLWEAVEWNFYVKDNQLMWHWSPKFDFQQNAPIRGYHEATITYILALSSPKYSISPAVYESCWKGTSNFKNGRTYHGYTLPIGQDYGGPLFFTHYSFLGLDPRKMEDNMANYWVQNVSHTLINRAYCLEKAPKANLYDEGFWGLTASDNAKGYDAHSPTKDLGTITPTAAMSSMPYTPYYSIQAMKKMMANQKTFDPTYGFFDAFSPKDNWYSEQFLAIDQNPIPVMIENYRSGLIWKLFMNINEVKTGLNKANISQPNYKTGFHLAILETYKKRLDLIKNPDKEAYTIDFNLESSGTTTLQLINTDGKLIQNIVDMKNLSMGQQEASFVADKGEYDLKLSTASKTETIRVYLN
jgi:hypothetical protein